MQCTAATHQCCRTEWTERFGTADRHASMCPEWIGTHWTATRIYKIYNRLHINWNQRKNIKIKKQNKNILPYLIIKAAATFRTFGHFSSATIVNRFPQMPTTIINIVMTAANVSKGRANLWKNYKSQLIQMI